ncbi:MAG TPA: trypsin-like peptidase domain-containing protein, partial [Chthoniobacteraceae bacterium]|nr:trypsin-like peptidase domain-containing protein [Chthoniobacteraceae bacterium]
TARNSAVENAVVKVFTTRRLPDPYKPWTKDAPSDITGSGVVIEGKRILTNAHVVEYASEVQIQASQAGDKISATVEAIAPGIDLAVLKLDDEKFFDTHPALPFASSLPQIKDAVMVYGYPTGGDNMSITKGIVSRIEFVSYHFPVSGLRIQIDAAINPGNSGGPAVAGDKMIGLAFSRLNYEQNIGYIIPCEEIELFLKSIEGGHYSGKPAMFDEYQTLENPALRPYLKLPAGVEGLIIHGPYDNSDPNYPLKEWDVVTKIGDTPVDDQGMIKMGDIRLAFTYLIQKIAKDGKIPLTIVRGGKEMKIELPVHNDYPLVVPALDGAYPSYFICGPMVFSNATTDFVGGFARANASGALVGSPLVTRVLDKPAFDGEQLVVVSSPFFPSKLSEGYGSPLGKVVKAVNGIPVKNLNNLVQILRDSKDEFLVFEFDTRYYETLVFKRSEIMAATDDILTDNGIRSQGSPDTMAVWNAKPAAK